MTQTADPGAAPERSSSAGMRRRTTQPRHGEASSRRGVGMHADGSVRQELVVVEAAGAWPAAAAAMKMTPALDA